MHTESPKIIMATVGPKFETKESFVFAVENNCLFFRLPFSYRERNHGEHISLIRDVAKSKCKNVNILADLPSARPRMSKIADFAISEGLEFTITGNENGKLYVNNLRQIIKYLKKDEHIKFLDGRIVCRIKEIEGYDIRLLVENGNGSLKSSNSLVFPESKIHFSSITDDDLTFLKQLENQGKVVDWIALSMISDSDDILSAKKQLKEMLNYTPKIMAKFEVQAAVDNMESIIQNSDGVMVARGDLGQAIPYEDLPNAQRKIIETAKMYGKPVFVATQALEIFAETGLPQRAELIDIATVKWLGADGIMLGKETVWSNHPLESIKLASDVMNKTVDLNLDWVQKSKLHQKNIIALEGPDGVGKTTVLNLLKDAGYKTIRGIPALWESPELKKRMIGSDCWLSSAFYFLSGSIENKKFFTPEVQKTTFQDRCIWSSFAVHYKKNPTLLPEICQLLSIVSSYADFPKKVFVLDAGSQNAQKRIAQKNESDKNLDELLPQTKEAYDREIQFFLWLKELGLPIEIIDASKTAEEVAKTILEKTEDKKHE